MSLVGWGKLLVTLATLTKTNNGGKMLKSSILLAGLPGKDGPACSDKS